MKNTFLLVASLLIGASAFAQDTKKLLVDYLAIKDALASDDETAAKGAIAIFQNDLKAQPSFSQKAILLKGTEKFGNAKGIEKQREAFEAISPAMWEVTKVSTSLGQPAFYQYCPMKQAYWISGSAEIKNPYYGAQMLTCGKVVESKK